MAEVSKQVLLASLLRYFHAGDAGTFTRVCNLAGAIDQQTDGYKQADLFFSLQLAGMIEVTSNNGMRNWFAGSLEDPFLDGDKPKVVGTTRKWFSERADNARVLIGRNSGEPLIVGSDASEDWRPERACNLRPGFLDRLPIVRHIEAKLVRQESLPAEQTDCVIDVFDTGAVKWRPSDGTQTPNNSLIRIRKRFSGQSYWIVGPKPSCSFQVLDPDWAFVIARNILGWPLNSFLRVEDGMVRLPRAYRLPCLLSRFLFANSKTVSVGTIVTFYDVSDQAAKSLLTYLE